MKSNAPLLPVRREVGNSSYLKTLAGNQKPDGPTNSRTLSFENLEDRRVLSATGFDHVHDTLDNSAYVTNAEEFNFGFQQDEAISHLKLLVNGEERKLSHADNVLTLVAGDTVEVTEIGFHSDAEEGVFAAEGYVNKIGDLTSASLIDYNDGRFSDSSRDAIANGGDAVVAGLNNTWTVESGWDRLTINLMHYTEAATEVEGRFFVNLQVGEPDFAFDTDVLDKVTQHEISVGDEVVIPGAWFNHQSGLFHNYGEVDIYHDCDPNQVIWAGALVGNAGDSVEGEFVNTRSDDPFSQRWTPDAPGEYTLKYYVDPEDAAAESNEDNNTYEIRLTVAENGVAGDFEDSESLNWTVDPNGTDTASSGVWEATNPVGTAWNGVQLQLDEAGHSNNGLVTGGDDDGTVGVNDVDGGVTSAISESLTVPSESESTLSFKYNFSHLHNSSNEDFFRVSVVGENATEVVLEERGAAVDRAGEWTDFSTDLTSFAGQDVQIMVEAADLGNASLVEAAIDLVEIRPTVSEQVDDNPSTENSHNDFVANEDLALTFTNEAQYSWGFGLQNHSGEQVDQWAVQIENATYELDPQQLTNQSAFELTTTKNVDGTFNHLLVGTSPIAAYGGIPGGNVEWYGVNFGEEVKSSGFTSGALTGDQTGDQNSESFADMGILTNTSGPLDLSPLGLNQSAATVMLSGLPKFVYLSAGEFDGQNWKLESADLDDLQMKAEFVDNTQGWTDYQESYLFKNWDIQFSSADQLGNSLDAGEFKFTTWQKV